MSAVDGFDTLEATPSRICINSIRFSTNSGSFRYAIDDSNILVKNLETRTSRTPRLNVHSIIFQRFSRNRAKSWEKGARIIYLLTWDPSITRICGTILSVNKMMMAGNPPGKLYLVWVAVDTMSCSVFVGQSCGYSCGHLTTIIFSVATNHTRPTRQHREGGTDSVWASWLDGWRRSCGFAPQTREDPPGDGSWLCIP